MARQEQKMYTAKKIEDILEHKIAKNQQ